MGLSAFSETVGIILLLPSPFDSLGDEFEYRNALGPGLEGLLGLKVPFSVVRSRKSGSCRPEFEEPSAVKGGLEAGDTNGDVWRASGMVSLVSKTKKASPPSPSFIA